MVLGPDRRRPVHPGPTARPQLRHAGVLVARVPVDPLPPGLLAEHGTVLEVPAVRARDPQRPARLALVTGIANVVVRLVYLLGALERVAGRAVVRPESPDIHLPDVERGLAGDDPLRHH